MEDLGGERENDKRAEPSGSPNGGRSIMALKSLAVSKLPPRDWTLDRSRNAETEADYFPGKRQRTTLLNDLVIASSKEREGKKGKSQQTATMGVFLFFPKYSCAEGEANASD